jgi:Excalibur calcium-binding domain
MALPRWILVVGLFAAFWLGTVLSTPSVSPANQRQGFLSDPTPNIGASATDYGSVPADDKDCRDFSSHAQAQAFFEAQGGDDPHRLDGDGDLVACEQLR